nr:hypothetical protein [Arthrobacter roseus]
MERTAAALCLNVDHAAFPAACVALVTEQHSLQIVVVDAVASSGTATRAHDLLDLVEEILADEWFVATWVYISLVDQEADVVRILEHGVELAGRYRHFRIAGSASGDQPNVGHCCFKPFD